MIDEDNDVTPLSHMTKFWIIGSVLAFVLYLSSWETLSKYVFSFSLLIGIAVWVYHEFMRTKN